MKNAVLQWSAFAGLLCPLIVAVGCGSDGGGTASPPGSSAATFREFPVPVVSNEPGNPPPGSWPDDLVMDGGGSIWFAEHHSNEIGRLTPSGSGFTYSGIPIQVHAGEPGTEMDSIAVDDSRGLVWVTENAGNRILRVETRATPAAVTEIPVATLSNPNPIPGDITLDAGGTPWFTIGYEGGPVAGAIGKVDLATNQITQIPAPTQPGGLDGIRFDRTGALWFVELSNNKVARLANGVITEFPLPRPNVIPTNLEIDGSGLVWVTEQGAATIAVLDPTAPVSSRWQELPVPTPNSLPSGIAIDRSGNVWFTEFNSSKIGVVIAATRTVRDFAIPTDNSGPEDVYASPDGRVFFTEQYGNNIGQISVPGLTAS